MPSSSASSLRIAASCWRSRNSRCCFSMPSRTSFSIVSATSSSARWSRAQPISFVSRCSGSAVSSSSVRCGQGQVAGVAGAVGQRGRVGDPLQDVDDLPGAALLQDRGGEAAVLAGQLVRTRRGVRLGDLRAVDPQGRAGADRADADPDPGQAADHGGGLAARQPADLLDHAERADRGVLAVQPGHQQHPRLVVAGGGDTWAASIAARTSGPEMSSGTTMVGSTTESSSGSTGRERVSLTRVHFPGRITCLHLSSKRWPGLFPVAVRGQHKSDAGLYSQIRWPFSSAG